jgi:predicted dehydrogenase
LLRGLAAAWAFPRFVRAAALGGAGRTAPGDRLALGMIGLGSMGMRHVKGFLVVAGCRFVAVCDVDATGRAAAAAEVSRHYGGADCRSYNDSRRLLARGDVDAVCIAVPDHWHAALALDAIRAGKDIYGEKPLARTIPEGRAIVDAVARSGCVWQTGSWQRSDGHFRFACELVRNEYVGRLRRVEVGIGAGHRIAPQPVMPVPEGLDYERWLGPAPWAPYTEKRCHWNFRWIDDYSGGQVTDWGAHHIDIAHWGMGADGSGPVEVAGEGEFPAEGLYDTAVTYRFRCTYAGGLVLHVASNDHFRQGVRFVGEDGWVHVTRSGLKTRPASLRQVKLGPNDLRLASPAGSHRQGHRRDFLDSVRARSRPLTPVEIGHGSIIPAHLANIAMRLGRAVRWDPARERIVGDGGAERMLSRPLREPWGL